MKAILCFVIIVTAVLAGEPPALDRRVALVRFEKAPIVPALRALGRATDTAILPDPDLTGEVSLELHETTLRAALAAMTGGLGYDVQETAQGAEVHRLKTVLYTIDYPQLTRSGSGSASITLGGANSGGSASSAGAPPAAMTGNSVASGLTAGSGSDTTQVSISQENQNTFWTHLELELRSMLKDGDALLLSRFSGVVQVSASATRQQLFRTFIDLTNRRITQQVEIEARLVEISLRDEKKLGVDWDLATGRVEGVSVGAAAPLDLAGLGGSVFDPNTFVATLGRGRATAVIHALQSQGEVRTVSQPRLRALNNQTAFVKVGEDRPFFRLQQTTTVNQPGAASPFNQTQDNYSVSTITIGTILAITPQVGNDGIITLDVLPAITRLQTIVTSPDGKQTAPVTEVKQASTIVRLREGETAMIGGLISEENGQATRSIPVLGKVPVVGRAFRSQATVRNRTELVIFLTPRVVR